MAPKWKPSNAKQIRNVKNSAPKVKKYVKHKAKKGVDKTLSIKYLSKKFLLKDKMELKMSPFRDGSQFGNDPTAMPNLVIANSSSYIIYEWGRTLSGPLAATLSANAVGGFDFHTPQTTFIGGGAGAAPAQVADSTNLLNGQNICFKKSYFNLDVAMLPVGYGLASSVGPDELSVRINNNFQPLQFRVLHLLQRRDNYPQPTNDPISIKTDLWLTDTGKFIGMNTAISNNRLMTQRVATANFQVISDQRFVLQGSSQMASLQQFGADTYLYQSAARSKYPSSKSISMIYDHREEVAQISQDGLVPTNEPIDMNFKHIVLVLAAGQNAFDTVDANGNNLGQNMDSTRWTAGTYGTTTGYDA